MSADSAPGGVAGDAMGDGWASDGRSAAPDLRPAASSHAGSATAAAADLESRPAARVTQQAASLRVRGARRYVWMLEALRRAELLRARWALLAALGAIGVGLFLKLTTELSEGELDGFDRAVLDAVVALRLPSLNGPAVDLTALGSVTVLTLIVVIAVLFSWLGRDFSSMAQLLVASIGGAFGSTLLKRLMQRTRPPEMSRLVEVASFSYPSGHSLASASVYLTLALVVARHLPTTRQRALLFTLVSLLALVVGGTRAYLGVHYPSDIAAGLSLGAGWALLVSAAFSYARVQRARVQAS